MNDPRLLIVETHFKCSKNCGQDDIACNIELRKQVFPRFLNPLQTLGLELFEPMDK